MPRGDKSKYTDKQERKADHIAEGYLAPPAARSRAAGAGHPSLRRRDWPRSRQPLRAFRKRLENSDLRWKGARLAGSLTFRYDLPPLRPASDARSRSSAKFPLPPRCPPPC